MSEKIGFYKGKHYTEYPDIIKELKRNEKYNEAAIILLELLDVIETESKMLNYGVAPWYYEQLSMIYNKLKMKDKELETLERFSKQKHSPGVKPEKLLEKYNKLKHD